MSIQYVKIPEPVLLMSLGKDKKRVQILVDDKDPTAGFKDAPPFPFEDMILLVMMNQKWQKMPEQQGAILDALDGIENGVMQIASEDLTALKQVLPPHDVIPYDPRFVHQFRPFLKAINNASDKDPRKEKAAE